MQLTSFVNFLLLAGAASALPWDIRANKPPSVSDRKVIKGTPISVTKATAVQTVANRALASPTDYPSTVLYHHNIHRANHTGTNPMTYSTTLAGYAAQVASSCKFAHNLTAGGGGYGQNIAAYGSSSSTLQSQSPNIFAARAITNGWYNSEFNAFLPSYYGQATPDMSNFAAWGHFSQVVWKASTQVGCASQYCAAGTIFASPFNSWFTVCNYAGPGNVGGQYGTNIGTPLGQATVSAA